MTKCSIEKLLFLQKKTGTFARVFKKYILFKSVAVAVQSKFVVRI